MAEGHHNFGGSSLSLGEGVFVRRLQSLALDAASLSQGRSDSSLEMRAAKLRSEVNNIENLTSGRCP